MKHLPKLGEIVFRGQKLGLYLEHYKDNGRVAVLVSGEDEAHYAILSCNLPKEELPDADCFFVKDYSENKELARAVEEANIFEVVAGKKARAGYVQVPIWRVRRYVWIVEHGTLSAFKDEGSARQFVNGVGLGAQAKITRVELQ